MRKTILFWCFLLWAWPVFGFQALHGKAPAGSCACDGSAIWEDDNVERFENATDDLCTLPETAVNWEDIDVKTGTGSTDYYYSGDEEDCGHSARFQVSTETDTAYMYSGIIADKDDVEITFTLLSVQAATAIMSSGNSMPLYIGDNLYAVVWIKNLTNTNVFQYDIGTVTGGVDSIVYTPGNDYKFKITWHNAGTTQLDIYNGADDSDFDVGNTDTGDAQALGFHKIGIVNSLGLIAPYDVRIDNFRIRTIAP